ncbi:MAG: hypothetical protein NWR21_07095 [Verrucomicrobiales bacterium]|nr:hypothetical protein [Verrucomicrobiales bacterium]
MNELPWSDSVNRVRKFHSHWLYVCKTIALCMAADDTEGQSEQILPVFEIRVDGDEDLKVTIHGRRHRHAGPRAPSFASSEGKF